MGDWFFQRCPMRRNRGVGIGSSKGAPRVEHGVLGSTVPRSRCSRPAALMPLQRRTTLVHPPEWCHMPDLCMRRTESFQRSRAKKKKPRVLRCGCHTPTPRTNWTDYRVGAFPPALQASWYLMADAPHARPVHHPRSTTRPVHGSPRVGGRPPLLKGPRPRAGLRGRRPALRPSPAPGYTGDRSF